MEGTKDTNEIAPTIDYLTSESILEGNQVGNFEFELKIEALAGSPTFKNNHLQIN